MKNGIASFSVLVAVSLSACSTTSHTDVHYRAPWGGTTAVSSFDSLVKFYVHQQGGMRNQALTKKFLLSYRKTYSEYLAKQETGDGLARWATATANTMLRDVTSHIRVFTRVELQQYNPQLGAFALSTPQQRGSYTFHYSSDNTKSVELPFGTRAVETRGVGFERVTVTLDLKDWVVPVNKQIATKYIATVTAYDAKRSVPMMLTYTPTGCTLVGTTLNCKGVVDHIYVYKTNLTEVNPGVHPDVVGMKLHS